MLMLNHHPIAPGDSFACAVARAYVSLPKEALVRQQ